MKLISRLPTQFCYIARGRGYGRPFSDPRPLNCDRTGRTYLSDDHRFRWRCYGPCFCRLGDEDGEVTYRSRYPTSLRNWTEEARLSVKLGNEYMQQFLLYSLSIPFILYITKGYMPVRVGRNILLPCNKSFESVVARGSHRILFPSQQLLPHFFGVLESGV